jgi:hypothetical protein
VTNPADPSNSRPGVSAPDAQGLQVGDANKQVNQFIGTYIERQILSAAGGEPPGVPGGLAGPPDLLSADLVDVLDHGRLPVVSDLDPYRLGATASAYGNADTYQLEDVYVPRETDDQLANSLRPGQLVIVSGPSKVGKSRTAFEVLDRHEDWRSARLVAPVPKSLNILVRHPALNGHWPLVLWLDDLQRFLPPIGQFTQ